MTGISVRLTIHLKRLFQPIFDRSNIYGADTGSGKNLQLISQVTGAYTSTLTLTYPSDGNVLTSMEFVGGTLYAG